MIDFIPRRSIGILRVKDGILTNWLYLSPSARRWISLSLSLSTASDKVISNDFYALEKSRLMIVYGSGMIIRILPSATQIFIFNIDIFFQIFYNFNIIYNFFSIYYLIQEYYLF